jgi:hypothetical protein
MTVDDGHDDETIAGIESLRTYDVSQHRTRRLRRRCHALLQTRPLPKTSAAMVVGTVFRRIVGPALAGAWCLAYLLEIIRGVAAVYLGTQ